jgi:DNA adenine methylase
MTDGLYRELAGVLHGLRGKALVSCYDCPLYRELYADFRLVRIPKKKDLGNGPKADAVECVWMNY